MTDPQNRLVEFRYNGANQKLTAATNALGYFSLMSYDHNGDLTNLVDALLRTNRWTYDLNGRNYETLYADNLRLSQGYLYVRVQCTAKLGRR